MGCGYDEYCCDRCARDAATAQKRAEAGLQPMPDIVAGDLDEVLRLREAIERFDTLEEFASLRAENEKLLELNDMLDKTVKDLGSDRAGLVAKNSRLRSLLEELAEEFSIQDYPEPRTGLIVECIDALGLDGWKR